MLFSSWRRPAPEKPAPPKEERYLEFDNLPFKLAVIQALMYEQKLLGEPYRGGDKFMERYAGDLETVSEEMSIQRLLPHIAEAEAYFQELKVPASLADRVEKLYVGEELDIYYQINPQWSDFDEYFEDGRAFDITAITERELEQFPRLKEFIFNMYHEPPEALIQQLHRRGIDTDCD